MLCPLAQCFNDIDKAEIIVLEVMNMIKTFLSLDNVQYEAKPTQINGEMGKINNRIVNSSVFNVDICELADKIGNRGQSFCPAIFLGSRKKTGYVKQQLIALDFDSGISYEEIRSRSYYYDLPIAFSYYTFSSTAEHEKFRIVFLFDCDLTDIRAAEIIIAMLRKIFPESDKACSDATHIYLGGKQLIECNEAYISFPAVTEAFYACIKVTCSSNFPRTIRNFANRYKINLKDNGLLDLGFYDENVANFSSYPDNIYINDGGEKCDNFLVFGKYYIRLNNNEIASEHTLSRHKKNKEKSKNLRRFSNLKYAALYCRLYKDLLAGDEREST